MGQTSPLARELEQMQREHLAQAIPSGGKAAAGRGVIRTRSMWRPRVTLGKPFHNLLSAQV